VARAAILDVDGTLVDTAYHHALCWYRAFRERGITPPVWKLHRHVGMGGDLYVAAVAGEEVEERHGDGLRDRWEELFDEELPRIAPLPGARGLVADLKQRGLTVVLATSSVAKHAEAFLDLLDARGLADDWTTKDDVEESKPAPDLVEAALAKAGTGDAVMVGDTTWDCRAAAKAGIETIGVLTGGFSEGELLEAGAVAVFETADDLRRRLDETPLAGRVAQAT
jgi:HAD superfamily hydrolase (TIGR01509 family)